MESTSSMVGIDGDAPMRETAKEAALDAISSAWEKELPPETQDTKNPVKVSPAAVVSTTGTR